MEDPFHNCCPLPGGHYIHYYNPGGALQHQEVHSVLSLPPGQRSKRWDLRDGDDRVLSWAPGGGSGLRSQRTTHSPAGGPSTMSRPRPPPRPSTAGRRSMVAVASFPSRNQPFTETTKNTRSSDCGRIIHINCSTTYFQRADSNLSEQKCVFVVCELANFPRAFGLFNFVRILKYFNFLL